MVSLSEIRDYMRKQLAADREVREVRAEGSTREEALRQGAIELGLPIRGVEFEVQETGSAGIFGRGRRPWVLLVYEAGSREGRAEPSAEVALGELDGTSSRNRDGEVFVKLTSSGVLLRVTRPEGDGEPATVRKAIAKLAQRGIAEMDEALVARVVKRAEGEYVRIGDHEYDPSRQSVVKVDVTEGEMKAFVTISAPGPGGPDATREELSAILEANGVVHGASEDALRGIDDAPRYGEPILVAEGSRVVNGADAQVAFNFRTDYTLQLREKAGRVDFKEINLIENVEAGQVVARKTPAEPGTDGMTVTGRVLPAKPGKDVRIDVGDHVRLSEDGLEAIAEINGQVLLSAGKVHVEPIHTVNGDVNLHTGNIIFLGTVIVRGNVEDGFTVKAAGNIEVLGSVGKCVLDAEGDVRVHQGVNGKNSGLIRSGRSVFAKFINSARVEAEQDVFVNEGIMHSMVDANRRIICQGRRAAIMGGRLRAAEEINAKSIGSPGASETIVEVGFDPKREEHLTTLEKKRDEIEKTLKEVELNIGTLEGFKRSQAQLPPDRQASLDELGKRRTSLYAELKEVVKEIGTIQEYLASLAVNGKVSVSDRVYPGVKIFIKNESLPVRSEFKRVSFVLDGRQIRIGKYEPAADDGEG
jgi:uncharacterized protein